MSGAGSGKAYGVELLVEKRPVDASDPWRGWLAYAYAEAQREQQVAGQTIRYPFDYDRRHTVNVQVNRRLGRHLTLGLTWRYGSGFPYTPPVSLEPLIAVVNDPVTNSTRGIVLTEPETGFVRLVPGFGEASNINSARLPDYHRLDMRVTFTTRWRDVALDLYVDLIILSTAITSSGISTSSMSSRIPGMFRWRSGIPRRPPCSGSRSTCSRSSPRSGLDLPSNELWGE